jgi:hypothetical protein
VVGTADAWLTRHVGETGNPTWRRPQPIPWASWLRLGPTYSCDAGEVTAMPKLFAARAMIGAAVFAIGILAGASIAAWFVPPP